MKPSPVLAEVATALYRRARFAHAPQEKRLPDSKAIRVTDDGRVALRGGTVEDAAAVIKALDWPPKDCVTQQQGKWLCIYLMKGYL